METQYLTAPQLRQRFGGISDMTLYRWLHDQGLGFPRPIVITRRRFFNLEEIEAFERRRAEAAEQAKAA